MPNALRPPLLAITLASLLGCCTAYAANDCNVTVNFVKAESNGANVELTFRVTNTTCAGSIGRFVYEYEDAAKPGRAIQKQSPSWRPTDGKTFAWTDVLSGSDLKVLNVRVPTDTIESAKN